MEQLADFRIVKTWDDKTEFINEMVTITVGEYFSGITGKHKIADPGSANAQFLCCGKLYLVTNAQRISTVEDWYLEELLPKIQMLTLLQSPMPI